MTGPNGLLGLARTAKGHIKKRSITASVERMAKIVLRPALRGDGMAKEDNENTSLGLKGRMFIGVKSSLDTLTPRHWDKTTHWLLQASRFAPQGRVQIRFPRQKSWKVLVGFGAVAI